MVRLPSDAHSSAESARSRRVLAEAEGFLRPLEPPQRRLLAGALGPSLRLGAEWPVRVLDLVLVAVSLDSGDAAIPGLLFRRDRLRLHQARHTYASFMIAAGVNAKALSAFMGHSSIKVTFYLYGHLMPGTAQEAAALLDSFLVADVEVATESSRAAAV